MILLYSECLKQFGNKYNINKLVANKQLFKLEKGVYSDREYVPEYQIIATKYHKAVFTLQSAFYYQRLTDVIPEKYYLATSRGASKISDARVVQIFENSEWLMYGAEMISYGNSEILMYNKERLLVELLRNKNKLPYDYYKEILTRYRKVVHDLDIPLIQDIAMVLPKSRMIMEALQAEVF